VLDFNSDFEVEVPRDQPQHFDHVFYFDAGVRSEIGLSVIVKPWVAQDWAGIFYAPRALGRGVSGVFGAPNPGQICVVNQGCTFLGDVLEPSGISAVPEVGEVIEVRAEVSERILVLSSGWTVAAIGQDGLTWVTGRIAIEDIRLDGVADGSLHGVADPDTDGAKPFSVDLRTGGVTGGATGLS
jgi:hypothetical protein